jgi:hypothetical protein
MIGPRAPAAQTLARVHAFFLFNMSAEDGPGELCVERNTDRRIVSIVSDKLPGDVPTVVLHPSANAPKPTAFSAVRASRPH